MVTGELKNKIDQIRQTVWNSGISNPITVVEQLTYLMFLHSLDEKELQTELMESLGSTGLRHIFPASSIGQSMRWSKFKNLTAKEIHRIISTLAIPAIKAMKSGRLPDFDAHGELIPIPDTEEAASDFTSFAQFMKDASFQLNNEMALQKVITGMDDLFQNEFAQNRDMEGDFYEYMLGQMSASGELGQFRTPQHIRDMMVKLMAPTPADDICDPACGTAGFLLSCANYIRGHYGDSMTDDQWEHFTGKAFTGFDTDPTMTRLASMNLVLHGIDHPQIRQQDSVSKQNPSVAQYTMIMANPPFKGSVDKSSLDDNIRAVVDTTKTELLFIALFIRMLKIGGRCASIVPDGVLFGSSKAHKALRKELIENQQLRAVISLPSGVFKPYAGVSTAVLIFTKTNAGGTDKVWFYDMKADGYSLDDKRQPIKENDIPDICARFADLSGEENRQRTEQSFLVPKQEIADNDYDLSINKYKKTEYVPVEYPPTEQILQEIMELDQKVEQERKKLQALLEM